MNVHEHHLMNQAQGLSLADLMSLLQQDQMIQWKGEQPLKVEDYLRLFPKLQEDVENVLVLIMGEVIQRETQGQEIDDKEYFQRFPHLHEQLKLQLEFHRALGKVSMPSGVREEPDTSSSSSPKIGRVMASMKIQHSRTLGDQEVTGTFQSAAPAVAEGTLIANRYKLRQQIGEGGMGTVWMADQTEPIKRKVAVKLIHAERTQSKTIVTRFEAERQAIALMDHPHIAKLLDAGTTDKGAPFFVMELVKGIPLNDFCDQHRLTISERLNLFTQICSAVQHAHQKGIIHRDLKPGNILVESHDGKPVPKVIDFGLAKATSSLQLTEHSIYTAFGSVMGTPAYMAPEQANFNAIDVDTRADVYALGVILYELLTGTTPITRESLKKAALDEMLRLIREQEAPTPSSRLSTSENTPSVAACRQIEPQKLGRIVKGELDWIVMKALNKERDRRYETANGFAKDIERFLNHEPVQAGPPNASYRFLKFVQRHRGEVIAASLLLLTLVAGVVGTTWGWLEARTQESEANAARERETDQRRRAERERDDKEKARQQAVAEKERADREKAISEAVKNFVTHDVFNRAGDRNLGQAADIKARTLLEEAAKTVGEKFKNQPEIELAVRQALANGFGTVGLSAASIQQVERVVELARKILPKDDPVTLEAINWLGTGTVGNNKARAVELVREAFDGYCRVYGKEDRITLRVAQNLLWVMEMAGYPHQVTMPLCDDYLAISRRVHGEEAQPTLNLLCRKATFLKQSGKVDEALSLLYKVQRAHRQYEHDLRSYEGTSFMIGGILLETRRYDEAIPVIQGDIARLSKIVGADHAEVTYRRSNLANAYWFKGDYLNAGPAMFDVAEGDRRSSGPRAGWGLKAQGRGVVSLSRVNRLDIAIARAEAWAGSDKPNDLAHAASLMCMVAQHDKDASEAEKHRGRALRHLQRAVDRGWQDLERIKEFAALAEMPEFKKLIASVNAEKPSLYPSALASLAATLRSSKKLAEAIVKYLEAVRLQEAEAAKFPEDENARELLGNFHHELGMTYLQAGNHENALKSMKDAYKVRKILHDRVTSVRKPDFGNQAAWSLHSQADVQLDLKRHEKAAELYAAAAAEREKLIAGLPPDHRFYIDAAHDLDWLARTWERAGRWKDAEAANRKALAIREAIVAANFNDSDRRGDLDWSRRQLAAVLVELGNFTEARDIYRKNLDLYRKTNDSGVHDALAFLGSALLRTGEWQEAETILKECVERREKQIPDKWPTFNAYSMYGGALFGLKRYAEAEPLLLKGFAGMKEQEQLIPAYGKKRLTQSLDRLIEFYRTTNKPDEVAKWRAMRAKYSTASDKVK